MAQALRKELYAQNQGETPSFAEYTQNTREITNQELVTLLNSGKVLLAPSGENKYTLMSYDNDAIIHYDNDAIIHYELKTGSTEPLVDVTELLREYLKVGYVSGTVEQPDTQAHMLPIPAYNVEVFAKTFTTVVRMKDGRRALIKPNGELIYGVQDVV